MANFSKKIAKSLTHDKKSFSELNAILEKIRMYLDNKNVNKFFDGLVTGGLLAYEGVVSQMYECKGVSRAIIGDENFWDIVNRYKIETNMPKIDPKVMMMYIVMSHTIAIHQINIIKDRIKEKPKLPVKMEDLVIIDDEKKEEPKRPKQTKLGERV